MDWPSVSIIIPCLNSAALLPDTLRAVQELSYPGSVECIVVDNCSADQTAVLAATLGAQVIRAAPRSRALARNRGARAAKGQIFAFLDSDCRPQSDWLTILVTEMKAGEWGAAQGWITPKETVPPGFKEYPLTHQGVPFVDTKGFIITKELFENLGGFDEALSRCEDIDFGWRLVEHGVLCVYSDKTGVWFGHPPGLVHSIIRGVATGWGLAQLYGKWSKRWNRATFWFFKNLLGQGRLNLRKKTAPQNGFPPKLRFYHLVDDLFAAVTVALLFPLIQLLDTVGCRKIESNSSRKTE